MAYLEQHKRTRYDQVITALQEIGKPLAFYTKKAQVNIGN